MFYDGPNLTRSTLVLRILLGGYSIVLSSALLLSLSFGTNTLATQVTLSVNLIGVALSAWLLYKKREAASTFLLVSVSWLATTAFLLGEIQVPVLELYAVIVVAAIFLIGRRFGVALTLLTILTTIIICWAQVNSLLSANLSASMTIRFVFVNAITLGLVTIIGYLIASDVEYSFLLLQGANLKLQERQKELEIYTEQIEQANNELAISERRYRHFFDDVPIMLHSIDQMGFLVDVNRRWLQTLQYEKDEVIGRRSAEFLTPESRQYAVDVALPAFFKDGFIKDIPYQFVKKSGEVIDILLSASELRSEQGEYIHSLASLIDVTNQKRAELELRESENRFRTLVNSAADCFLLLNAQGELIGVNDYTCQTLGYTREELLGMRLSQFDEDWTPERVRSFGAQLTPGVAATVSSTLLHKAGHAIPVEIRVVVTTIGKAPVFLGLARDVTEQRAAQSALQASEHRFRSIIFNQAQQFIGLLEPNGKLFEANKSALDFGGFTADAVIGHYFWETPWWRYDAAIQKQLINAIQIAAAGSSIKYEVEVIGRDEQLVTIDFSLTPIRDEADEIVWLLAEGRDITEIHQASQALERSVKEKELLLKEIHHRVKNNLQIVSSILRLQSGKTNDPALLAALSESQLRIRSMELIHQQLYQSNSLSQVNLGAYCQTLVAEASRLYRAPSTKIDFQLNLADLYLDIDTATTCGLLLQEMISNALKYAFPTGKVGTIFVELYPITDNQACLTVSDDGIGIPADIPFPNPTSLGFRLIQLLSAQIHAQVRLVREPNTKFEIIFMI